MSTNLKYDTESLWRKDRDHFIHPWTDFSTFKEEGSMVMANSEGAYVIDSDGNRYIDGIGGLWCVNIGYANEEMAEAIADQVRQIPYFSPFGHLTTPPAAELAAKPVHPGLDAHGIIAHVEVAVLHQRALDRIEVDAVRIAVVLRRRVEHAHAADVQVVDPPKV